MAWNSPCIQNGALQAETPGMVSPHFISREDARFQSLSRRAHEGEGRRRDGRDLPRSSRETKRRRSLLRVRLTPRLWVSLSVCLVLGCGRRHLSFLCRRCELPRAKSCATCFTALRKEPKKEGIFYTSDLGRNRPGKGARGKSAN